MTCDINTIIDEAKCYHCVIDQGFFYPVFLYLLCKTAEGIKVSCDPRTLVNDARCYACEIPPGYMQASILKVLCDLNQQAAGPTCIVCEDADPEDGIDIPPCDCSLWVTNKDGVPNLWKSSDGATWQAIIWSPV